MLPLMEGWLRRNKFWGVLSLIFWTLTVTVSIKYIGFVLRADNNGEGGILSLIALVRASFPTRPIWILVIGYSGPRCSWATR